MSKKNGVVLALAIFFGIPALMTMLFCYSMTRGRSVPKYYPDDWGAYVWVSEEPKAFITYDTEYGGQMEIDGEMCNIHFTVDHGGSPLMLKKIDDLFFMRKDGTIYMDGSCETEFRGKTTYKEDSIICKNTRDSKNYARQEIVFTKYAKDEVSPADFGFEFESWDGFVPDWLVEDKSGGNTSKPMPTPTPEPTPQPTPEPIPTPEFVYLSADSVAQKRIRHDEAYHGGFFLLLRAIKLWGTPKIKFRSSGGNPAAWG